MHTTHTMHTMHTMQTYTNAYTEENFQIWLKEFKLVAVKSGVSQDTVNLVMDDAIFLSKVIEYDRYQPEFYEDTFTYIKKRSSKKKIKDGYNESTGVTQV